MELKPRERLSEHVHGLLAGSLLVLALFVASALPLTFWLLIKGEATLSTVLTPALFLLLLLAGVREARSWRRYLEPASEA